MDTVVPVPGISIGSWEDARALTGCTVVLPGEASIAGVSVRGGAPGTRETDLLAPGRTVERIHGLVLAGGSAFGLAAAEGVMGYLEEKGRGFPVGQVRVPIVPAAILFDLGVGDPRIRPDYQMGYRAAQSARPEVPPRGNVGAGTGATVGKVLGMRCAMKGGLGYASLPLEGGATVAALVAVNSLGDVVHPDTGRIVAGTYNRDRGEFAGSEDILARGQGMCPASPANTTLGVLMTDASLTRQEASVLATVAHNGLARVLQPCHTPLDGDTLFALSVGDRKVSQLQLAVQAVRAISEAVLDAVLQALAAGGIPSARDLI